MLADRGPLRSMKFDELPWVTFVLSVSMITVYVVNPALTPLTYTVFAPWMHGGFSHILQNLLVFVVLGVVIEQRVVSVVYGTFVVLISYLALYLPVVFNYGGLSRGASGLTMALTGYLIPVLLVMLSDRFSSREIDVTEIGVGVMLLFAAVYLTADSWVTVQRFVGLKAQPEGVSVASHMTGLLLGVLWFICRSWRHGLTKA